MNFEIKNLSVDADFDGKRYNILNDINIKLSEGKTISLVGESGSGKTTLVLSVLMLLNKNLRITSGSIVFDDKNIVDMSDDELRDLRGKDISIVFQEPLTALNPVIDIETQMTEVLTHHHIALGNEAKRRAAEMIESVNIPRSKIKLYPHNFSGGQRQRILIAMSLITNPKILIADEPTTALDVITQIEILNLIKKFKEEKNLSVILITHNLAVVSAYSDYVYVMYLGEIMEAGRTINIIKNPKHPYTKALLESIVKIEKTERLKSIKGTTPSIFEIKDGCRFMTRCDYATEKCSNKPPVKQTEDGYYRCWNL
jgi:oligopeptide/dipeptide ABC transporter ATP-binding protein